MKLLPDFCKNAYFYLYKMPLFSYKLEFIPKIMN